MRYLFVAFMLTASFLIHAADQPLREAPQVLTGADHGIGEVLADVSFKSLEGDRVVLSKYSNKKAVVLLLWTPNCPISKKYAPRMSELEKEFAAKEVQFLLFNCSGDPVEEIKSGMKLQSLSFPALIDSDESARKALRAKTTTDVFVLGADRKLLYRGAIDDQYGQGYSHEAPRHNYLRDALNSVLAGEAVKISATTAPGCELPPEAAPAKSGVTFYGEVLHIMQRNCQECHRPGGAAPFALMNFDQVRRKAQVIKRVTARRTMPPWFADPKVGGPWANDKSLTDAEIKTLAEWADNGTPEGDPKLAPPPREWADGWRIGKPDLIFQIPKPVKIPAQGTMPYQYIKVPTNLTEDTWVQAVELLPTNPEVVHHSQVFLIVDGKEQYDKAPEIGGRGQVYFAAQAPGETVLRFPEGSAKLIPKGAIMLFEIHYTPIGVETEEQIRVGVIKAKEKPKLEVKSFDIRNMRFRIPPGAKDHKESAEFAFKNPTRLYAFQPHMHLRGKSFTFDLVYPDGKTEPILNVPRYDFRWQTSYRLKNPLDIPAGSKLKVTGWFDNSADNPANPDPKAWVSSGGETTDEMLVGFGEWSDLSAAAAGNR